MCGFYILSICSIMKYISTELDKLLLRSWVILWVSQHSNRIDEF